MANAKLLIVAQENLLAEGLKTLIQHHYDFTTHAVTASTEDQIIEYCTSEQVDVLLVDLDHTALKKFSLIKELLQTDDSVDVIGMTNRKNQHLLQQVIRAGARGLIMKSVSREILKNAIDHVMDGKHFICNEITVELAKKPVNRDEQIQNDFSDSDLTKRETEVLELICDEMTNPEIAQKLQLSVRTIDTHRRNLLQKTGARNTVGLVKYAVRHHLLNLWSTE